MTKEECNEKSIQKPIFILGILINDPIKETGIIYESEGLNI